MILTLKLNTVWSIFCRTGLASLCRADRHRRSQRSSGTDSRGIKLFELGSNLHGIDMFDFIDA